jgi:hypothetical protein
MLHDLGADIGISAAATSPFPAGAVGFSSKAKEMYKFPLQKKEIEWLRHFLSQNLWIP